MKTLHRILGSLAAALAIASCTKETADKAVPESHKDLVDVTVEASVPENEDNPDTPETRVTLNGATPLWTKGDQIGIFTEDLTLCPPFTAGSGGSKSTTFSGQKPEYSVLTTAFFPYDASASISKSGVCLTLPRKQSGEAADAIMVGTGNEKDGFAFRNVCSLVRMTLPAALNLRKVELVRDDRVAGPFTVDTDSFSVSATAPSTYLDSRAEINGTLSGEYVLAVLPSSSKKLEMALTNDAGKVAFVSTTFKTGNAFVAGRIKNLGTFPTSLTFFDAALVADPTNTQL